MDRYDVREELGNGTFGTVFRAWNRTSHEEVAIKRMKRTCRTWRECASLRELQSLKALSSHPQIVALFEVIRETDENVYFVFEYMPDGNLYEFMKKCTPRKSNMTPVNLLTEAKIQSIAKQIFQGLAYLHAKGFVHRDIKPENLLMRGDTCKVADFGLAREVSSPYNCTEYVSTRWYRAPEVLLRSPKYGTPIDLFAVGCIIAELYGRIPLFSGETEFDQLCQMIQVLGIPDEDTWPEGVRLSAKVGFSFASFADKLAEENKPIPHTPLEKKVRMASPKAIRLMKDLLDWNPEERPSANQALHNQYFSAPVAYSPKDAPTVAITESAEKNRSLKLVTASPGYWHPDYSPAVPYGHQSPPPLAVEMPAFGTMLPRHEEPTGVHSGFSACDYGGGNWPEDVRFVGEN